MNYYKRGFLNKDEGLAAFVANVNFEASQCQHSYYINAGFTISDCSRQITLDFDVSDYDAGDYDKAMYKLNTLINELQEFNTKLTIAKIEFDIAKVQLELKDMNDT